MQCQSNFKVYNRPKIVAYYLIRPIAEIRMLVVTVRGTKNIFIDTVSFTDLDLW